MEENNFHSFKELEQIHNLWGYEPTHTKVLHFSKSSLAKEWVMTLQDLGVGWAFNSLKPFILLYTSEIIHWISILMLFLLLKKSITFLGIWFINDSCQSCINGYVQTLVNWFSFCKGYITANLCTLYSSSYKIFVGIPYDNSQPY